MVLRLALIEEGKLFRSKYEAVLPMSLRLTFPGKETSDSFVQFVMDSSGKKAFGIDMRTMWYVQETFTEEENECFNNFEKEREDDCTTINHSEHVVFDWMMSGPGVLHPGKIIDFAVDNIAAEGMSRLELQLGCRSCSCSRQQPHRGWHQLPTSQISSHETSLI